MAIRKPASSVVVSLTEERVQRAAAAGNGSVAHAWKVYRDLSPRLKLKSRQGYNTAMNKAMEALGCDATPEVHAIQGFINRLVVDRNYTPAYANQIYRVLRTVCAKAAWSEHPALMTLANRVRQVEQLVEDEPASRCPPKDALQRCLMASRNAGEQLFIILCCQYSMRVGEVMGLIQRDYDAEDHTLNNSKQVGGTTRKNKKRQQIIIRPEHRELMEWVIVHRDDLRPKTGAKDAPSKYKLIPFGKKYVANLMGRLRAALGDDAQFYFPKGTAWHAFRHLGATQVAIQTGCIFKVMAQLGDSSTSAASKYVESVRGTKVSVGVAISDE